MAKFSQALFDTVCERIAAGESLRKICLDADMPGATIVYEQLSENADLAEQYARARAAQADYYAEQIIQISDDGNNDTYIDDDGNKRTDHDVIARSRLRVDARKWYAGKLAPKKYGDKTTTEISGIDGGAITVAAYELTDDQLAQLIAQSTTPK